DMVLYPSPTNLNGPLPLKTMARKIKKKDQTKPWSRRTSTARPYKLESRSIISKRFLIVCEGENTEPCYFRSFPVQTAEVKAFGMGRSKTSLVQSVIALAKEEPHDPDR